MSRRLLVIALFSLSAWAKLGHAQGIEEALIQHPDSARAAYYLDNAGDILELRAQVSQGSPDSRLRALRTLATRYPDAAHTTALDLLKDDVTDVALAAAELLAASIVMSDHGPHGQAHRAQLMPYERHMIMRHTLAREALRSALLDSRSEIRLEAASILLSLADTAAVAIIDDNIETGLYSANEVVNLYTLADPAVVAPLLEPYLAEGPPDARASAVSYLGSDPEYFARIRDDIFLNAGEDELVRIAAAQSLSANDDLFASYGLAAALDSSAPPGFYLSIIEGYAVNNAVYNTMNAALAESLLNALGDFKISNPEFDIRTLESQLQSYED